MSQRTALYRHWDAAGRLLYVGISSDPLRRMGQHKAAASWSREIANITLTWFPTRNKAAAAERRAVKVEKPIHNTIRFVLPQRKVGSRLPHGGVAALIDHYNAHDGDSSTIEGCAQKLNLTVPALRKMLWLPRGVDVTLTADDVFELLLRTCRGSAYASAPYMVECLVAKMPKERRKLMASAQQERRDAWEAGLKRRGRPARRPAPADGASA